MNQRSFAVRRSSKLLDATRRLFGLIAISAPLVLSGCIAIPYGTPIGDATDKHSTSRPMVLLGEARAIAPEGDMARIEAALLRESEQLGGFAGPELSMVSDADRLAFSGFAPGSKDSYRRVSSSLPPHYLLQYELSINATDLPTETDEAGHGFIHGYLLLTLSLFPMYPLSMTAICSGNVYAIEGDSRRHLKKLLYEGKQGGFGNFWWWGFWHEHFSEDAIQRFSKQCRSRIVAGAMAAIARLEAEQSVLVRFETDQLLLERERLPVQISSREASGIAALGDYYALVIGNQDYQDLPSLKTALNDARAVARVLSESYGFSVTLVGNATRSRLVEAFSEMRRNLGAGDSFLVFYAGHGLYDEKAGRGYWLPVDARSDDQSNWLSNAYVTDTLRAMDARHVLVISDSCYSGTLTRVIKMKTGSGGGAMELASLRSRVALTSGGLEPVEDDAGDGRSVFASALLRTLENNAAAIDGQALYRSIVRPVMLESNQTPEYGDIRNAGHQGGEFYFVRREPLAD